MDRETELLERLKLLGHTEAYTTIVEILKIRRERYRDKLENIDNPETRGKAKECKDLLQILLT